MLESQVCHELDEIVSELAEVNRFIYDHPEIALEEKRSSGKLAQVLQRHGFQVTMPVAGLETGFVASRSAGEERPHLAFVAQYDALPEIGHGCGHNLVASASLGAALAVAKVLPRLSGKLSVIGTPSEEVLATSGKLRMIGAGLFQDIDVAMMTHPHTKTSLTERFLAIKQIAMQFKGKSAHAGDASYLGVNAYDAVQLTFTGLSYLRQQLRQDARVHWGDVKVSGAMNVIPDAASATIGVRASDNDYTEELTRKVINCIEGAALMTGCRAQYQVSQGYQAFKINRILVRAFEANLKQLGVTLDENPQFGRAGSTDMGNVSQVVPSIYPLFKITEGMPVHSAEFCKAAGTKSAFEMMLNMAKAMAMTAAQCLGDAGLLRRVWDDFARA